MTGVKRTSFPPEGGVVEEPYVPADVLAAAVLSKKTPAETRVECPGGHYEETGDERDPAYGGIGRYHCYAYLNPGQRYHCGTYMTVRECRDAINRVIAEHSPPVAQHLSTQWLIGGALAHRAAIAAGQVDAS
jgi:hypothetical protein